MGSFRDVFKKLFVNMAQSSVSVQFSGGTQVQVSGPGARPSVQDDQILATPATEQPGPTVSLQIELPSFALPPSHTLRRLADPSLQARARACLATLGDKPTESQWRMILSPTVSTRVIAGAGSGKSTTLIQRILILHKLLGISLDELHVFSFTRASTQDFQMKLERKLALWEERIEGKEPDPERRQALHEQVKRTVSTFHSVIARLCRDVLPGGSPNRNFFDLLGNQASEDEAEQGGYNPFVNMNLSHEQEEILNSAHTHAYQDYATYRALMQGIATEQERQEWLRIAQAQDPGRVLEEKKWWAFLFEEKNYHGFERQGREWVYNPQPRFPDQRGIAHIDPYRAALADQLYALNIQFSRLPLFWIRSPLVGLRPGEMYAAFQVGTNLFLHVHRYDAREPFEGQNRLLYWHEFNRRRFMALYLQEDQSSDQHKFFTPDDFEREGGKPEGRLVLTSHGMFKLERCLNLSGHSVETTAPAFRVKLPGDLRARHIAELFYQEGMFLESLGLEVEQFQTLGRQLDPTSHAIAAALPLFWRSFNQELEKRDLVRFHDVLSGLRDLETLRKLRDKLKHLQHLLIDEFQDISPEIVDWLRKTLAVHLEGEADVSVTAIGDDFQSIYGWRGSHPAFLMNFERYFLTTQADQTGTVVLEENFRSRQPIIDAAEAVLAPISTARKVVKHGKSVSIQIEKDLSHPIQLKEAQLSWNRQSSEGGIWLIFSLFVASLLRDLEASGHLARLREDQETRPLAIYILARTNATLDAIPFTREQLRKQMFAVLHQQSITSVPDVRVGRLTFHRSKGLEADVVLLLDDSQPSDEHPLRELAFSQAAFLGQSAGTYAQAMNDEARRLAYVALTRARFGVMWIPLVQSFQQDENNGKTSSNSNGQEAKIPDKGCFVLVKKHLQELEQSKIQGL
jgi:superfamily I DNA/RNA helicase